MLKWVKGTQYCVPNYYCVPRYVPIKYLIYIYLYVWDIIGHNISTHTHMRHDSSIYVHAHIYITKPSFLNYCVPQRYKSICNNDLVWDTVKKHCVPAVSQSVISLYVSMFYYGTQRFLCYVPCF
jgi:hypothetical protein